MSNGEHENGQAVESRSSVKITLNAKGDAQVEVKSYVGDSLNDLTEARENAVATFLETLKAVGRRAA